MVLRPLDKERFSSFFDLKPTTSDTTKFKRRKLQMGSQHLVPVLSFKKEYSIPINHQPKTSRNQLQYPNMSFEENVENARTERTKSNPAGRNTGESRVLINNSMDIKLHAQQLADALNEDHKAVVQSMFSDKEDSDKKPDELDHILQENG